MRPGANAAAVIGCTVGEFWGSLVSWLAVAALTELSVRTPFGLPGPMRKIERVGTVLPALPQITLAVRLASSQPEPRVQRLAELLTESVQQNVRGRGPVGRYLRVLAKA